MRQLLIVVALLLVGTGVAQAPDVPPVEELMQPEQFRAAGLHKLTDDELANLNAWLGAFASSVLDIYGGSTSPSSSTSTVVESRIDGEFEGWEGDTIFELENGQVWQQAEYAYMYHYAYSPRVLIIEERGGYVMQVEGVDDSIRVRRIQ